MRSSWLRSVSHVQQIDSHFRDRLEHLLRSEIVESVRRRGYESSLAHYVAKRLASDNRTCLVKSCMQQHTKISLSDKSAIKKKMHRK